MWGGLTAGISDFGATLVSLLAPDREGHLADVVLGFDTAGEYLHGSGCLGATVGRNANRVGGSCLPVGDRRVCLTPQRGTQQPPQWAGVLVPPDVDGGPSDGKRHHPGPGDAGGDQGFPGMGRVEVTYALAEGRLRITYQGVF